MQTNISSRKGAKKAQDIPKEVLELLNQGKIETVNLTEWLNVDHVKLLQTNFLKIGVPEKYTNLILEKIKVQNTSSTRNTIKLVGSMLYNIYENNHELDRIIKNLSAHVSDSIRCYTLYLYAQNKQLTLENKLTKAQKLIADKHFGVREVAWMAFRPEIEKNLEATIPILSNWAKNKNENIRRFTTECIRPRGVWCKHIEKLKENPEIALPILEHLKSDTSKYVQDSVGNWLNDASKYKPDFVIALCDKWEKELVTKETEKIIKRAKRTINKNK